MRLDKYLKVSRLIKRRTVANEVADAGRILINGKIAKASQAVKAGDIIEVTFGNRPIKVKVLSDVERAPRMWPARCTRSLRRASRHKSPGPCIGCTRKGDEPCRKKHPETRSPRRTI